MTAGQHGCALRPSDGSDGREGRSVPPQRDGPPCCTGTPHGKLAKKFGTLIALSIPLCNVRRRSSAIHEGPLHRTRSEKRIGRVRETRREDGATVISWSHASEENRRVCRQAGPLCISQERPLEKAFCTRPFHGRSMWNQ
jgi:hypothetical protein